jgi:hypothetical protein
MTADVFFPESRGRRAFGIKRISAIHTEKSWKEFTGIAELTLPRNVSDFKRVEADSLFALGDPIEIKFGYASSNVKVGYPVNQLPTEFVGYISDVADGVPYVLKCEDEMFRLKRGTVTVSKKGINLKQLLETIAPDYRIECPDIPLGTVRYTEKAPIAILENLKKELGIYTYFVDKVLHSTDGNSQEGGTIKVLLEKNAVSENLNRKSVADEKVLVKFKSLQRNGKYLTVETGDKNGTVQVRNWPYLTKPEIEVRAKRIVELQKKKGFDGTVELFGRPRVEQGMILELASIFYKNMTGKFYIDKVVKDFDKGGIRQQLTLGNKSEV